MNRRLFLTSAAAALVTATTARAERLLVNSPGDGFLNLRTGPGSQYNIIRKMYHGSAVETLVNNGTELEDVVVVDPSPVAMQDAHADGLAVVTGDATRREVLRRAGVADAEQVIITTDRDDSNVLATLTVRQLNPDAWIVAAVREQENAPLMRQSGADSVITSSDAVGRLLGLSTVSPTLGSVMEDLLTYGDGLEVAERELLVSEVGQQPQRLPDQVIAVVRDEKVYRYFDPVVTQLARGDRLVVVRPAKELPWAPRPGTHGEDLAEDA